MAVRVTQAQALIWYITNNAKARVTQAQGVALYYPQETDPCLNQDIVLAAPGAFPTPSEGGPQYTHLIRLANEFSTLKEKFATGGSDYRARSAHYIARWRIAYDALDLDQGALLDAHYISTRGPFLGFDFTDPRTGVKYRNVRYAPGGYKFKEHEKLRKFPVREVELVWSSASGSVVASDASGTWDGDTWDSQLFGA